MRYLLARAPAPSPQNKQCQGPKGGFPGCHSLSSSTSARNSHSSAFTGRPGGHDTCATVHNNRASCSHSPPSEPQSNEPSHAPTPPWPTPRLPRISQRQTLFLKGSHPTGVQATAGRTSPVNQPPTPASHRHLVDDHTPTVHQLHATRTAPPAPRHDPAANAGVALRSRDDAGGHPP